MTQAPNTDPEDSDDLDIPVTVNWRALTRDEAKAEWAQLGQWVHWLVNRYQLTMSQVPACWPAHGALVEELSALRTAWVASYEADTRSPIAGIEWHQQFDHCRSRMTQWTKAVAGGCDGGKSHKPEGAAPPDPAVFATFVAPDLEGRQA